jgi:hypothetical protein
VLAVKTSEPESLPIDPSKLPEGLRAHGRPLSVHRPWAVAATAAMNGFFARVFGRSWEDPSLAAKLERGAIFVLAVVMLGISALCTWVYLFNPPKNEDPRWPLGFAIVTGVIGVGMFIGGIFHKRSTGFSGGDDRKGPKMPAGAPDCYLVYKDGVATVTGEAFEFLAWREIKEVSNVWKALERYPVVIADDDRQIVIRQGYTGKGELLLAINQRVNEILVPKALRRIEEGKSAKFGPFAVSGWGLKYKKRKARWDDVQSMKLETFRGLTRLTIYARGHLFAFCWCDMATIPNMDTFYDVLCRTAPEHLLTKSTRPRW